MRFRPVGLLLCLAAIAEGQPAANQLARLNGELAAQVRPGANPEGIVRTAAARAVLLRELIAADPAAAMALALPADTLAGLRRIAPEAVLETAGEFEGSLEARIADDFEHGRTRTSWHLHTGPGVLDLYSAEPIARQPRERVVVRGMAIGERLAVAEVATAQGPAAGGPPAGQQCVTTGPQNIAVLMVTTPSNPVFPAVYTPAKLTEAFFGSSSDPTTTSSLNGFWHEMSSGLTSATGQVFGPIALSQDFTCDQTTLLENAAIAAADGVVDFTQFNRTALVFPVSSCPSYAGLSTLGCSTIASPSKGAVISSFTWLPVVPTQNMQPVGLYAHELGHSLGLSHSSTDDYGTIPLGPLNSPGTPVEYGDLYAVMGYPYNGSGYTAGQYVAQHKSLNLHWLRPGDYQEVTASGTFTLAPYETTGVRSLRVRRDAASGAWLWIEYRQPAGDVDGALAYLPGGSGLSGALIRYEDPALDPLHTYLLNFNPAAAPNDFHTAALQPGGTWSDPYTPLTLTVNSASAAGLSVTVSYDQPCATPQFSATAFGPAGGSGTVTVSAAAGCAWTVSAPAGWIQLTGSLSGTGNGSVGFTVAQNSLPAQRTAYIAVGRHSTPIVQTGPGAAVVGVTPKSGTQSSGTFTFQFSDPKGAADISQVILYFDPTGCLIFVQPSNGLVQLGGGSFQFTHGGASATNGLCTASSDGGSISTSGNQLTVTLPVAFSGTFAGTHRVMAQALASGGITGVVTVGEWTVPATGCSYILDTPNRTFPVAGGNGTVSMTAPAGCGWNAQTAVPWLSLMAGATGTGNGSVTYQVAANPGSAPRSALLLVSGQAHWVYQGGGQLITGLSGTPLPATAISATLASVSHPAGLVMDGAGNTYIASQQQNAVFKVDAAGNLTLIAGAGTPGFSGDGGPAAAAQLNEPDALALDAAGNLYIADYLNQRVRKVDANGNISTIAGGGGYGYAGDGGPSASAKMAYPSGLAVDGGGNLYIADANNHAIRKVDGKGTISTIAGNGTAGYGGDGGPASGAQLNFPRGVAADAAGNLYIADSVNYRVREVAADGSIRTVAGNGKCCLSGDGGPAANATIGYMYGLTVDGAGNLYIPDFSDSRVRKVTSAGVISTIAFGGAGAGPGDPGLNSPASVAADAAGNLVVADINNNRVRRIAAGGAVSTLAGGWSGGDGGPAAFAQFNQPTGVVADGLGNVYIADTYNNRVRKVTPDGTVSTFAGTGAFGFSGDGQAAVNAQLRWPMGLALDGGGNLYIADASNSRVRKVSASGTITTIAGGGAAVGDGGAATAAQLKYPQGIALDGAGNLYIADSSDQRIRKVDAAGKIGTVAGTAAMGYSGDGGPAVLAALNYPNSVAVDGSGAVYISDGNNTRIRKVADGVINTIAGTGTYGHTGDGGAATNALIGYPYGLTVDGAGAVYFADRYNQCIRKIAADGTIATLAGSTVAGYSGNGGAPNVAQLYQPSGVFVDPAGSLYFTDTQNNVVRLLEATGSQPVYTLHAVRSGSLRAGQGGTVYSVTVANANFAGTAAGAVTLTAIVPPGIAVDSISGDGWSCAGTSCTRSDALAAGTSFPPVTVGVSVGAATAPQATAQFLVTGGGGIAAGASDLAPVAGAPRVIGSVVNGASYLPGIAAGAWVSITGTNLSATSRTWRPDEYANGTLPLALDGVGVTIDGMPAAIAYVSPTQLNVQAPALAKAGPVNVVVTGNGQASAPVAVQVSRNAPGVFAFSPGGGVYPAAVIVHPDGSSDLLGPAGLFGTALVTVAARAGDVIELFCTGLGPTIPVVLPGQVYSGAAALVDPVTATIGGVAAPVGFAGLVGAGLYQVNVTVPAVGVGDQPLVLQVNGVAAQVGLLISVRK